jgi:phage repressor protein C with HTH and peptisase S24 domain
MDRKDTTSRGVLFLRLRAAKVLDFEQMFWYNRTCVRIDERKPAVMSALTLSSLPAPSRTRRRPARAARQLRLADAARAASAGAPRPTPVLRLPQPSELAPAALAAATVGELPGLECRPVSGESMPDALLSPGDVVLVQRFAPFTEGDLYAVRPRGGEALRYRRVFLADEGRLRLQPENRAYEAELVEGDEVLLDGRVVAIVRHRP